MVGGGGEMTSVILEWGIGELVGLCVGGGNFVEFSCRGELKLKRQRSGFEMATFI